MAWKKDKKGAYWNEDGCSIKSVDGPVAREWHAFRANGDLLIVTPTLADAKRACDAEPSSTP